MSGGLDSQLAVRVLQNAGAYVEAVCFVEKCSGLKGRLVRPMSAKLLEPTIPESEGKLDRERLLDISGRSRDRQIALAAEFGIVDYPSPAGGCKLTEEGFCRKLKDLQEDARRRAQDLRPLEDHDRRHELGGAESGDGALLRA